LLPLAISIVFLSADLTDLRGHVTAAAGQAGDGQTKTKGAGGEGGVLARLHTACLAQNHGS
jgi:hypothetical protein